jgi:hypothetical protein
MISGAGRVQLDCVLFVLLWAITTGLRLSGRVTFVDLRGGGRNGSNAPPGGGAYDSSTKGCLLLRIPQKANCTDFSSLLYYPEGGK